MDGVGALLESITLNEIDSDNELKPAQQSAKAALSALIAVQRHLADILGQDTPGATGSSNKQDWTYTTLVSFRIKACKHVLIRMYT